MPNRFLAVVLALLCPSGALAAGFNDFIPGAKAMGMGMAFSAVADDPYAMFFNPSGTANTPYTQTGMSLGRMLSPVGTLSFAALTYLRPYEPINTATVGAAYYGGRQTHGGDKDAFLFNYAQELRVPGVPLAKPLRVGGNFKFINVDEGKGHFGMGFDGGVTIVKDYVHRIRPRHPAAFLKLDYRNPEHKKLLDLHRTKKYIKAKDTDWKDTEEAAIAAGLLK